MRVNSQKPTRLTFLLSSRLFISLLLLGSLVCVDGYGEERVYTPSLLHTGNYDTLHFLDLDRDGLLDVVYYYLDRSSHGGQFSYLMMRRGTIPGSFTTWKIYTDSFPPHHTFLIEDWNGDGREEILYRHGFESPALVRYDGEDFVESPALQENDVSVETLHFSGDFDGDGYLDAMGKDRNRCIKILFGSGQGIFSLYSSDIVTPSTPVITDWNGDGADDVLCVENDRIALYPGDADRSQCFRNARSAVSPIQTQNMQPFDRRSILLTSATQAVFLTQDSSEFTFTFPILPESFSPADCLAADVDRDGRTDLVSWNGNQVGIYVEIDKGIFEERRKITVPYTEGIDRVTVVDIDLDGRNDLAVFSKDIPALVYYDRPASPTPTPTPENRSTPTPVPTMTPTPTAVSDIAGAIRVSPGMDLHETVDGAPSGSILLVEPGDYSHDFIIQNDAYVIHDTTLQVIGSEPNQPFYLKTTMTVSNSCITLQNFSLNPFPPFSPPLILQNTDADLVNVTVFGTGSYYSLHGQEFPGGPTVIIQNSRDKTVRFIGCEIEAGSSLLNLLVHHCHNTTIDLCGTPHFGTNNAVANVRIEDCSNIQLLLGDPISREKPSLNSLSAFNSTLTIVGGTLRGTDGYWTIPNAKGFGLELRNHTTAYLDGARVYAGDGGQDGIPGLSVNPLVVDETSVAVYISDAVNWSLYE